jgi:hypothetical protein
MALSITATFDLIAPDLASDPNKAGFISLATTRTKSCFYGGNYTLAVAYLAAHMLTLSKKSGSGTGEMATGEIASKREGDLAISYHKSTAAIGQEALSLTPYGLSLLELRKSSGAFLGVTGGNDSGC